MTENTVQGLVFNLEKAYRADKAVDVEAVIQYHLTRDEGCDFIINITEGASKVEEGTADAPTMTLAADGRYSGDVLLGKEDGILVEL